MQTLLASLVPPLHLSLLLLAVAALLALLRWRRTAYGLATAGVVWSLGWSLPATSLWLGGWLEARHPHVAPGHLPQADAIVVLGGHTAHHRANWFLPLEVATARSRIAHAADLYHAGRAPRIVLSGGALAGDVSEARGMAHALRQRGVPRATMLLEHASRSTFENAALTREALAAHAITHVLLVTSALHMPRAIAAFAKQTGVSVTAAPVAPQLWLPPDGSVQLWLPDWHTLDASRSIVKEYAALLLYWLRGWV